MGAIFATPDMPELKQVEPGNQSTNTIQGRQRARGVWPWIFGLLIFSVFLWMLVEWLGPPERAKTHSAGGRISTVESPGAHHV
jgi:hypothetical protein